MSQKKYRYDAFISYTQLYDKHIAIALRRGLMELGVDFRNINNRASVSGVDQSKVLSLKDPESLLKVAEVSAQIQGKTVDELISEDRRRQRIWSGVLCFTSIVLIALTSTTIFFFRIAQKKKIEAEAQKREANFQRDAALANLKKFKLEEFKRNIRYGAIGHRGIKGFKNVFEISVPAKNQNNILSKLNHPKE